MTGNPRLTSSALLAWATLTAAAHAQSSPGVVIEADGQWLAPTATVALSRDFPSSADGVGERDAVRVVLVGFAAPPERLRITSRHAAGGLLDSLSEPPLAATPCPPGQAGACWATLPLRLTPDHLDRDYALARQRSLEGELGGLLQVEVAGSPIAAFRIGAPRSPAYAGIERLSARLRVRIPRLVPGGPPVIGGSPAGAVSVVKKELAAANRLWGQCGVDLLGPNGPDIQIVDPPPTRLIAVGCDAGLPASGGAIQLRVAGKRLKIATRAGESPRVVAERLARALRGIGQSVRVSPNQRVGSGASGSVDVLLQGTATVSADADASVPVSSDATLGVCLGEVDLSNGLTHFVENDAAAGTVEERALVKPFDDGDPSTIEVFVVPSFDQSGRIGESFIDGDGAGIQNTVIIDRSALRAGPRSYALAHELGHVLLDMPGHPDDYGVDQSMSLMDSDASDASVFGPRRLSLEECERVLRESGPQARIPLLSPWPLLPVPAIR